MNRACLYAAVGLLVGVSTGCGDSDDPPPAATPTATATATSSALPTSTPTVSSTATPTDCACTSTPTGTATASPTPSATPEPPALTYLGIARADDVVQPSDLVDAAGRPVFLRPQGQGMTVVLEARRGALPLADGAYDPGPGGPGAQFLVSRPLGDGSLAVCDITPPIGGVPGVDPPQFSDDPTVLDAINDLGCRVNDGTGAPRGRRADSACTHDAGFNFTFVDSSSAVQFCLPIARAWSFPPGDTIVAARVHDVAGHVSATREIVVRVAGDVPFGCENGIGERHFTPARPGSALLTSVQPGDASLDPWLSDPIRICAGPDLGRGVHVLALPADADIGVPLADGSTLCARLSAQGSAGILDCGGIAPHDVLAVQDAGEQSPIEVTTGLGLPAGSGAASIRLPISLRQLRVGSSPSDCARLTAFNLAFDGAITTAGGVAEVVGTDGSPVAQLSADGVNFDCSSWRSGGRGTFVLPFPAVATSQGAVAAVLVLQD